jgi:hypothetical protein
MQSVLQEVVYLLYKYPIIEMSSVLMMPEHGGIFPSRSWHVELTAAKI